MLDGLDAINWDELSCSGATSTTVPQQLRGLLSPEAKIREAALDDLYTTIHHQGSLCPAAVPAIPFLIAMSAEPAVPSRREILQLLASMTGGAMFDQDHRSRQDRARYPLPEWLQRTHPATDEAEFEDLPARIIAAVAEGLPVYLQILDDGPDELRYWMLSILWAIPQASLQVLPRLRRLLETTEDSKLSTHLLVSLSFFTGHDQWFVRLCDGLLTSGGSAEVREAAAVARLAMSPPWPPSLAAARVAGSSLAQHGYFDSLGELFLAGRWPLRYLRTEEQLREVATILIEALPAAEESYVVSWLAEALVETLSGSVHLSLVRGPTFAELRLQALTAILTRGLEPTRYGPNGETDIGLYLYLLLCMVFIDDAQTATGMLDHMVQGRSAVLQQVLNHRMVFSEALEMCYYLLSAYLAPGGGMVEWLPDSEATDVRAIIQDIIQWRLWDADASDLIYWEFQIKALGALLRHFGLPDSRQALRSLLISA
jgi:hypothetical protein